MKKVAFIGDSHSGAIYEAYKSTNHSGFSLDFYIWRSFGTKPLTLRTHGNTKVLSKILIKEESNNILNLERYSSVVICGMEFSLRLILEIYRNYRTLNQSLEQGTFLISDYCISEVYQNIIRDTQAMKLIEIIQNMKDINIVLCVTPFPSEYFMLDEINPNLFKTCVNNGDQELLREYFNNGLTLFEEKKVKVIVQPDYTMKSSIFTIGEYCRADPNDRSPESAFSKRDLTHMNKKYGDIMLNKVYSEI